MLLIVIAWCRDMCALALRPQDKEARFQVISRGGMQEDLDGRQGEDVGGRVHGVEELEDRQARDRGVHEARAPDHEVREGAPAGRRAV